jgi:hypothetical protein
VGCSCGAAQGNSGCSFLGAWEVDLKVGFLAGEVWIGTSHGGGLHILAVCSVLKVCAGDVGGVGWSCGAS